MKDEIFEYFKLIPDKMEEVISEFIINNSNEEGIDLSRVYLAYLSYSKPTNITPIFTPAGYQHNFGINCPINKTSNYKKPTLVFIQRSQSDNDHVFIDMFNKKLLQSTYVNIDGIFSLLPERREGVTAAKYQPLNELLRIDRLSYRELRLVYNVISKYNTKDIRGLSKQELSKKILIDVKKQRKRRKNIKRKVEDNRELSEKEQLSKNTQEIYNLMLRNMRYIYENVPRFYIGERNGMDDYEIYRIRKNESIDHFWTSHLHYESEGNYYLSTTFDFGDGVIFRFWPTDEELKDEEKHKKKMNELKNREDNNRSVIRYIEYSGEPEILIESLWEIKKKELPIDLYQFLEKIHNNGFTYELWGEGKLEVSISINDFKKMIEKPKEHQKPKNKGKHRLIKNKSDKSQPDKKD